MTHAKPRSRRELALLAFAALGVVYGDIGTSPLYALKECFSGLHSVPVTRTNVLGVMSLVFWAINFVVSFKYISFVMRADNRGEGGVLALLALVRPHGTTPTRRRAMLILLGLFGAALLYGDGIITPAISVLGAVEGLSVATPAFEDWVVPVSAIIITILFWAQRHGTSRVGAVFGPIMLIWFISIAALGVRGILLDPAILGAVNPMHAVRFMIEDGMAGFLILGSVVLVVTGGEALYADMGHFGPMPIRVAWYVMVLPALLLNYFGQSALLLHNPAAATNPFYSLVPGWALYPMVGIATAAAVVASQALISGAFSLTRQAVQLGYAPRLHIVHTSRTEIGQIYVPQVNQALWIGCLALVLTMRTSSNLAAAYGVAVTGTMIVTTMLFYVVERDLWNWSQWHSVALAALFLAVDLPFFAANLVKVSQGGWIPLAIAALVFLLMTTWSRGRARLAAIVRENTLPLDLFLPDIGKRKPHRVPGVAVFLSSVADGAPPVLLHHLKHNKVLHERVLILSVVSKDIPQVADADRVTCVPRGEGFYQVAAKYGFMETPDIPAALMLLNEQLKANGEPGPGGQGPLRAGDTSYYLGRETLIVTTRTKGQRLPGDAAGTMARWRRKLFAIMARNAQSATAFFGLPPNRVVELGAQIQF